jgi:hypothetical protein
MHPKLLVFQHFGEVELVPPVIEELFRDKNFVLSPHIHDFM